MTLSAARRAAVSPASSARSVGSVAAGLLPGRLLTRCRVIDLMRRGGMSCRDR